MVVSIKATGAIVLNQSSESSLSSRRRDRPLFELRLEPVLPDRLLSERNWLSEDPEEGGPNESDDDDRLELDSRDDLVRSGLFLDARTGSRPDAFQSVMPADGQFMRTRIELMAETWSGCRLVDHPSGSLGECGTFW